MTVISEIVRMAMQDAGVIGQNETPTSSEMQDGFTMLNQMIAMWRTQSLSVYCQKSETFQVTGQTSYTIGAAGDLNIERPYNIDEAFWSLNGVDTPLIAIHSFEDYQDIQVKSLGAKPSAFYYRPDFPQGQLFVWPIPNAGTVTLTMRIPLPVYTTINDSISLPPEYEGAVRWNLAEMLCASYGAPITQAIALYAKQTKRALKIINTQIKTMRMPTPVISTTLYNIRSGS